MMRLLRKIYNDSLLRNSLYLISSNLSTLILGFFFWIIAARYYAPHDVGTMSALISSMMLIAMISSLGFPTALAFYLPRDPINADRIINSCLVASIVASLLFSIIFAAGIGIWAPPLKPALGSLALAALFCAVTAASTVSALIGGAFVAGRRSSLSMTKETLFGFVKILPLPFFAIFGGMGIFMAWGAGLLVAVIVGFIFLSMVWKKYLPIPIFDPIIKSMAGFSAGNYLAGILSSFPRLVLPVIIVNLISAEASGFFFIAMMVASLLYGIPQSISNSLLAESSAGGELWGKVREAIRFNAAILIPGVLLFMLFGRFVLNLFNPSYAENAATTLVILAVASLPLSLSTIFSTVRNAQKRVASVVNINLAVTVITLVLSVPLMRSSGIEGAAIAYLVANTITALAVIYKMKSPVEFASKIMLSNEYKRGDR